MNHSPSGSLALRKAIIGFTNYKTAEGLTDRSVDSYRRALEQWVAYAGDVEVAQISKQDIEVIRIDREGGQPDCFVERHIFDDRVVLVYFRWGQVIDPEDRQAFKFLAVIQLGPAQESTDGLNDFLLAFQCQGWLDAANVFHERGGQSVRF